MTNNPPLPNGMSEMITKNMIEEGYTKAAVVIVGYKDDEKYFCDVHHDGVSILTFVGHLQDAQNKLLNQND